MPRGGQATTDFGVGTRRSGVDVVEVDDGNFDYNERIVVETSQKNFRDYWIRPVGGVVNQDGPFIFNIEPQVDRYLQLNRAALEVTLKVVRGDGTDINWVDDIVAPVNLLGATMWQGVEVSLNGSPFSGASSINCGYKAYIETMLSCDADARDSHLHASFFHLDSPREYGNMSISRPVAVSHLTESVKLGQVARPDFAERIRPGVGPVHPPVATEEFDVINTIGPVLLGEQETDPPVPGDHPPDAPPPALSEEEKALRRRNVIRRYYHPIIQAFDTHMVAGPNKPVNYGFENRYRIVAGGTPFDMYSPITHDFFRLNNHLGPGNRVELKLIPYKGQFTLNAYLGDVRGYKLRLLDLKLHLRSIERRERIPMPLKETYLMNETQLHKQVVAAGVPSITFRMHNGGVMPKTVVVAMARAEAVNGAYDFNPFYLHHFHVSSMSLIINGEVYPTDGLRTDFTGANSQVARAYHWMYENTGAVDGEKGNIVSWPAFQAGCFIVPFDLTPDKCNGLHNHDAEYGYIDLSLTFSHPLRHPIYVLYELVFSKVIVNDKVANQVMVLDVEGGG